MECGETRELLSAYFDHELSATLRSSVAEHVQCCAQCGAELVLYQRLSGMAKGLADPQPADEIWSGIEAGLAADREYAPVVRSSAMRHGLPNKWSLNLVTTAVLVFLVTGVIWLTARSWRAPDSHADMAAGGMAAAMQDYLQQFPRDPEQAQRVLLAKYDGQPVDISQASRQLGYQPVVAGGLPERYALESVHILKMPCCTCVQTICRRDDGKKFAIFENDSDHPVCFSSQPRIDTQCNGCPCSVVHADHGLIASFTANKRQLTVVGAQDLAEIADLISHFSSDSPRT